MKSVMFTAAPFSSILYMFKTSCSKAFISVSQYEIRMSHDHSQISFILAAFICSEAGFEVAIKCPSCSSHNPTARVKVEIHLVQQVWPHSALSSNVPGEQGYRWMWWSLAWRPVIDHAQLSSGDGHLVPTGVQVRREEDQATLILYILEFTLL